MNSLILGTQYITDEDRALLSFCGDQVTSAYIRTFAKGVTFSEKCLNYIACYPAPQVLRYCILLAFAAMKSEDFPERFSYGFKIAISSSSLNGGCVYLDANGVNILCVVACQKDDDNWEIRYLNPVIFSEMYLYKDFFIGAVLWACNEVYYNKE